MRTRKLVVTLEIESNQPLWFLKQHYTASAFGADTETHVKQCQIAVVQPIKADPGVAVKELLARRKPRSKRKRMPGGGAFTPWGSRREGWD